MPKIILASGSPRRKELLASMGVDFDVVVSNAEEHLDHTISGAALAEELALLKAGVVADEYPDAIVIGADTVVSDAGKNLGKPQDAAEAVEMLRSLSGHAHEISTGVAVICRAKNFSKVSSETVTITMNPYDDAAVRAYVATGDPFDKAGGYAIQTPDAAFLIASIDGDRDTIMGLPRKLVRELLDESQK